MLKPLLMADKSLLIFILNGHGVAVGVRFVEDILDNATKLFDPDMSIDEVHFVAAGWVPWIALRGMRKAFTLIQENWLWFSVQAFVVGILMVISFISNIGRRSAGEPPRNQICSSIAITMRKEGVLSPLSDDVEMEPLDIAAQRFSRSRGELECARTVRNSLNDTRKGYG
jgi:hypothetical protein